MANSRQLALIYDHLNDPFAGKPHPGLPFSYRPHVEFGRKGLSDPDAACTSSRWRLAAWFG